MTPNELSAYSDIGPSLANQVSTASADIETRLAEGGIIQVDSEEIRSYLGRHPQLARALPNICAEVRQALGDGVELSLEVYKDPEVDDQYLTLYVRKDRYERDILERLHAANDRFAEALADMPGHFLLATDFARPRGSHVL